jgi:hypothetical protein
VQQAAFGQQVQQRLRGRRHCVKVVLDRLGR